MGCSIGLSACRTTCFTLFWLLISNCCLFTDSTNSSENIYTMMNPIGPGGNRPNVSNGHFEWQVLQCCYHAKSRINKWPFVCFVVPNGTRAWRAHGWNGWYGAASYERITRWVAKCSERWMLLSTVSETCYFPWTNAFSSKTLPSHGS